MNELILRARGSNSFPSGRLTPKLPCLINPITNEDGSYLTQSQLARLCIQAYGKYPENNVKFEQCLNALIYST